MEIQEEQNHEQAKAEVINAEILASVSHELRSPLASIKGYTATLLHREHHISRQERQEFLMAIRDASNRLESIVDRFLEMSQLETGSIKMMPGAVDASRIAREAILRAEQHTSEHSPGDFTFHLHLKDALATPSQQKPLVWADPRLLREVLDNLLDNAILYSPEGGRIDIVLLLVPERKDEARAITANRVPDGFEKSEPQNRTAARQWLDIVVCDNGLGIPDEHLERIFDRFHRVDTRLTRTVNGLGLGLTICKRIVELHRGSIWAESCPGGGSAFHVRLPLAESEE